MPNNCKLVRDKIPAIIKRSGQTCKIKVLEHSEYMEALEKKAHEELLEIIRSQTEEERLEELADLLEVVHAMTRASGHTIDELEHVRRQKAEQRGGFDERIYLVEVSE